MTRFDTEEMISEYIKGSSLVELGRRYGVAHTTIARRLRCNGISLRTPNAWQLDSGKIVQEYLSGMSSVKLGRKYGVSPGTISSCLHKHGVPLRKQEAIIDLETAVEEYCAGVSAREIARRQGTSGYTVLKHLENHGIPLRESFYDKKSRLDLNAEQIISAYGNGATCEDIGRQYNVSGNAIRLHLEKRGITRRDPGLSLPVNHKAFSEWNEESEYWAGFLFADGCIIDPDNGRRSIISLTSIDSEQVENYRKFLRSEHKIYTAKAEMRRFTRSDGAILHCHCKPVYTLTFRSTEIAQSLRNVGMFGDRVPSEPLVSSRHFWRGLVDGDGYVHYNPNSGKLAIGLLAQNDTLGEFKVFMSSNGISTKARPRYGTSNKIYELSLQQNMAARVIALLYRDASIALERKAKKVAEIMASNWKSQMG